MQSDNRKKLLAKNPAKMPFRTEGEIEIFPAKQKFRCLLLADLP